LFLLRQIYEKATALILIATLVVVYVLGLFGYSKMMFRALQADDEGTLDGLTIFFTMLVAFIWPLVMFWSLVVEASK
jgi:hypothetical protein